MRALLIVIMMIVPASAHEALTGWSYDAECCSDRDCKQVDYDDVIEDGYGGWFFIPGTVHFDRTQVRPSGDAHFHVCMNWTTFPGTSPHCIYVVQGQ